MLPQRQFRNCEALVTIANSTGDPCARTLSRARSISRRATSTPSAAIKASNATSHATIASVLPVASSRYAPLASARVAVAATSSCGHTS